MDQRIHSGPISGQGEFVFASGRPSENGSFGGAGGRKPKKSLDLSRYHLYFMLDRAGGKNAGNAKSQKMLREHSQKLLDLLFPEQL